MYGFIYIVQNIYQEIKEIYHVYRGNTEYITFEGSWYFILNKSQVY